MILPCEECLKLPLCRHKSFTRLLDGCDEIRSMLYENPKIFGYRFRMDDFDYIVYALMELMKPTRWDAHRNEDEPELTVYRNYDMGGRPNDFVR